MIGRSNIRGIVMKPRKVGYRWSCSCPQMTGPPATRNPIPAMVMSIHSPARVSTILRTSMAAGRAKGTRSPETSTGGRAALAPVGWGADSVGAVVVLMRQSPLGTRWRSG
uniref:Uncharacterized protein n=1 Tax=Janibacter limosus TaxID=53458 RepID=A0AC61U0X9_9MICO|nr:hypothetical protein [Janibacter limosus]